MSLIQSVFMGFIQGLGEFLPISSSGHLLLARIFFGIQTESPAMKMLDIFLHVGTLIPVLIVFRKEWMEMILHPVRNKTFLLLVIASLPTLVIYILAKKITPDGRGFGIFDNGWFLGTAFIITSFFLLICDMFSKRNSNKQQNSRIGMINAAVMGIFQGIGMIPGVSRSGSTILGGVSTGLNKTVAARFSFMMSVPAILGSMLMEGKEAIELGYLNEISIFPTIVGIIVSAVVGYLSIRFMLKLISKVPLAWFALYLAVIGIAFLILQLTGSSLVPSFSIPPAPMS
jgi:undecaprenyl-diphosphatase